MQFFPGQHIHCIGIGGFGISAIARILLLRGFPVSGSDRASNTLTQALARDGATIYKGHCADYLGDADMVIATSAVGDDHVEIIAANERGIPVYRRRDILTSLMEGQTVVAVAGTHGKTTTTSMIVHILRECGKDPSYIVGGILASTGTNAGVGTDDIFVIEADEYANMFLGLKPNVIVLTSIEYDHPDFFESEQELFDTFLGFVRIMLDESRPSPTEKGRELPSDLEKRSGHPGGKIIACADDPRVVEVVNSMRSVPVSRADADVLQLTYYGIDNLVGSNYLADNLKVCDDGFISFRFNMGKKEFGTVRLGLPGKHNVRNALAAMLVCGMYCEFDNVASALESFQSTGRRFEVRGTVDGIVIIDDYAHHPTAIRVNLDAARTRYPEHTIWAVWQPHMFSRTQKLIDDYATAFGVADTVVVTDIYAAREDPIPGVDSAWAASRIQHADVHHTPTLAAAVDLLVERVRAPAVILILSAGDAPQIGVDFLDARRIKTD